ncbi:CARDB domain-containing protein [Paenibacillus sp.]|uniref:CARDB domain-containing protein n=1 Tax=Paenibacillus sp. TaxID=58172 RepID=UPI0028127BFC|nr:CARDB domain-containing protein [Paenibacillus sp.]
MMGRRNQKWTALLLLLSFIFSTVSEMLIFPSTVDAADVINLNFGKSTAVGGKYYFSTSTLSGIKVPIAAGREVESWTATISGKSYSGTGAQVSGGNIILPTLEGEEQPVYSRSQTNPGHKVTRTNDGKRWRTGANDPDTGVYKNYEFEGDACGSSLGISSCPGFYPANALNVTNSGSTFMEPMAAWLRDGSGRAMTYSKQIPKPNDYYYFSQSDVGNSSKPRVENADVSPSYAKIVDAVPVTPNLQIIWFGEGNAGYGGIKLALALNYEAEYIVDSEGSNYSQVRNYRMIADTIWEAKTYAYWGTVSVTYKPLAVPDLVAVDLKNTGPISIGSATPFACTISNAGTDVKASFTVTVNDDSGATLKTQAISSLASGTQTVVSFTATFSSAGTKTFTCTADSTGVISEGNESNNSITKSFTATSPEPIGGITADLDVVPNAIDYRESFQVIPNIQVTNGCAYQSHKIRLSGSNGTRTDDYTNISRTVTYTYPSFYPSQIAPGTVNISIQATGTCGTTDWVTKPLIVNNFANNPPEFRLAWAYAYDTSNTPITQAIKGERLKLIFVDDPEEPTPYDPDGDNIYWNMLDWDRASNDWLKSLRTTYGETLDDLRNVVMIQEGSHTMWGSMRDEFGAVTWRSATVTIVDPNPVPVITLPNRVVEGRTYSPAISGANSYSPVGRTITQYRWTGVQNIYPSAGKYPITLEVADSTGLWSKYPATAEMTVQPDLPPVIEMDNPGYGIRGSAISFRDRTHSPDGDPIETQTVRMACDLDNDGSYADETFTTVTTDGTGRFGYTPNQVGNCQIVIYAKEGLGLKKSAEKAFFFRVVNQAPEANFDVQGSDFAPPNVITRTFSAAELLSPAWNASNFKNSNKRKDFFIQEGALSTSSYLMGKYVSPTSSNVRERKVEWYCSDWYYNNCYAIGASIDPDLFLGPRGRVFFHSNPLYPTNYWPIDAGLNSSTEYFTVTVDNENDKLLMVGRDGYTGSSSYKWYTRVYRISDLKRAAYESQRWVSGGYTPTPIYRQETSVNLYVDRTYEHAPPPPPSNVWTNPPTKYGFTSMGFPTFNNAPITADSYYGGLNTMFGGDSDGNTFNATNCVDAYGTQLCDVQKKSADGTVLWTISRSGTSGIRAHPQHSPVRFISEDGKNLIVDRYNYGTYQRAFEIYRVSDGALLGSVPGLLGFSGNRIVYNQSSNLIIYDVSTMSQVATIPNGPVNLTITSDGNIAFATYAGLYIYDFNGTQITAIPRTGATPVYGVSEPKFFGDGKVAVLYTVRDDNDATPMIWWIVETDVPASANSYQFGQFQKSDEQIRDGEVSAQIKLHYNAFSNIASAGLSARMQDYRNMYRLEVTGEKVRITKIVNGIKTILGEANSPLQYRQYYNFKLRVVGDRLRASVDGVPLINVRDSQFASGMYGPYSEKEHVLIKNFTVAKYEGAAGLTMNTAVVDTTVDYVTSYLDPESDPRIDDKTKWTFMHTEPNKFLNAGDGYSGLSSLNGRVVTSPILTFDRVGKYKVSYEVTDDPAPPGYQYPNAAFEEFRMESDTDEQDIIVHRRPIAQFTLHTNADHSISWNETPYDPDRWLSPSNYSTEPTGIDYATTRGILNRKYNYTAPSGVTVNEKLTHPRETGVYTARLAVADEYGVWSEWAEQSVNVTLIPANAPPVATMTYPAGTQASPTMETSRRPTLRWSQTDADPGTVFTRFQLQVTNEANTLMVLDSGELAQNTTATAASWIPTSDLPTGQKLRVRVRVHDGTEWSAWSAQTWIFINHAPVASLTYPTGTQANPTVSPTPRPIVRWTQTDPDPGTVFEYFEVEISNEANNLMRADSGQWYQHTSSTNGSWSVDTDLPLGEKLRTRVRVFDGIEWSSWSEIRWLLVNRSPIADFTWTPATVYEKDDLNLVNTSTDPDGDALTYVWTITRPDGMTVNGTTTDITLPDAMQGIYTVRLRATDPHGAFGERTKTILVQDLTIAGQVSHTAEWETYRQTHNAKFPDRPRAITDFWAGEAFVLSATVTNTGSSTTKPVSVVAELTATGDTKELTGGDRVNFSGTMVESDHATTLTDGPYVMRFTVTWSNGHIETDDVPFNIVGSMFDAIVYQQRL